jgi:hypothetical protein
MNRSEVAILEVIEMSLGYWAIQTEARMAFQAEGGAWHEAHSIVGWERLEDHGGLLDLIPHWVLMVASPRPSDSALLCFGHCCQGFPHLATLSLPP